MDKATFNTGLATQNGYGTRKHGVRMKCPYLKPTFKSWRSSIRIWDAIIFGLISSVYFLQKKRCINSEIYVNQVFKQVISAVLKQLFPGKRPNDLDEK